MAIHENENTLIRSTPCAICGASMLWTQAAWTADIAREGDLGRAAYRCLNGHVVDPVETPQCPGCGIHDTAGTGPSGTFKCQRCHVVFFSPREPPA
jgi:hypothetical protein